MISYRLRSYIHTLSTSLFAGQSREGFQLHFHGISDSRCVPVNDVHHVHHGLHLGFQMFVQGQLVDVRFDLNIQAVSFCFGEVDSNREIDAVDEVAASYSSSSSHIVYIVSVLVQHTEIDDEHPGGRRVTLITLVPRKKPFGTVVGLVSFAGSVVWCQPISHEIVTDRRIATAPEVGPSRDENLLTDGERTEDGEIVPPMKFERISFQRGQRSDPRRRILQGSRTREDQSTHQHSALTPRRWRSSRGA